MKHHIELSNATISVTDVGSGPVLLLIHGFPLDHSMWQSQIVFFQSSHRVLAPDLRGFGDSTGTLDVTTMQQYADDLSNILSQLDITQPVTVCGLSMGGYIAFQFALNHPHKLASLILCDTKATADSEEAQQNRRHVAQKVLEEGPNFLADAMPEKLFSPTTFNMQPQLIEQTRHVIRSTSASAIASAALGMAERPDVAGNLNDISVPALLIVGENDAITTIEDMQLIADKIPNAQLCIIPDAGHMAPLENPLKVNEDLLLFLQQHSE